MLAANVSVAEKILKHFPFCSLLRYAACPCSCLSLFGSCNTKASTVNYDTAVISVLGTWFILLI